MTTNGIHSATVLHGDEYMRLYANGMIGRRIDGAANYGQPSFNWRVTGAQEYDKFGRPNGLHYSLEDVLYTRIEWKFKNGNQRVHITDYDHGTWRVGFAQARGLPHPAPRPAQSGAAVARDDRVLRQHASAGQRAAQTVQPGLRQGRDGRCRTHAAPP